MANYLFKENPRRRGRRLPPKEWFYYMVERVKKNLQKRGFRPRPGSPYKTIAQVAPAIVGGMWWGTIDGLRHETKRGILMNVIRNRASGKVAVVTGRKGAISRAEVEKTIGRQAAAALYGKLKLTKTEIAEAKELLRRGIPAIERVPELRKAVPNPRRKKFTPPFRVDTWFERDRSSVVIYDVNDNVVAEWWDDDVQQLFEDGFLVAGKGEKALKKSALEYAAYLGLIDKEYASNPELLLITGNPAIDLMDKKRPPSFDDFQRAYPKLWKKALKKHKEFHGVDPGSIELQWVDADVPPILVKMGDAPDVTYHVKGASRKQKKIPFKHDYKGKVHVCTDVDGKVIVHIPDAKKGRGVKITDWVHG